MYYDCDSRVTMSVSLSGYRRLLVDGEFCLRLKNRFGYRNNFLRLSSLEMVEMVEMVGCCKSSILISMVQ